MEDSLIASISKGGIPTFVELRRMALEIQTWRFLYGDLTDVYLCHSRGPRIGESGVPRCGRGKGHSGRCRPNPEYGWGNEEWLP
jgi:hypothetical protein